MTSTTDANADQSLIDHILTPGSSLSPTFQLILDGAFVALFLIFLALLYLTSGNLHIVGLIAVELALWASVKWYVTGSIVGEIDLNRTCRVVHELKNAPVSEEKEKTS